MHLNGDILVYDLRTGEFVRKLEIPDGTQLESNDFALDISIRNDQVRGAGPVTPWENEC